MNTYSTVIRMVFTPTLYLWWFNERQMLCQEKQKVLKTDGFTVYRKTLWILLVWTWGENIWCDWHRYSHAKEHISEGCKWNYAHQICQPMNIPDGCDSFVATIVPPMSDHVNCWKYLNDFSEIVEWQPKYPHKCSQLQ